MKKSTLGVLVTLAALSGCYEDSKVPETSQEDRVDITTPASEKEGSVATISNPLLKELTEIIEDKSKPSGLVIKNGQDFITSQVEASFDAMNINLANKDLKGFMGAYNSALKLEEQLTGIGPLYAQNDESILYVGLIEGYFGNIATRILSSSGDLGNKSNDCFVKDVETAKLSDTLYNFNRRRQLSEGEKPDNFFGSGHVIYHDDKNLTLLTERNISSTAILTKEFRYGKPGAYTDMVFSTPARLMVYALIRTSEGVGPLDSYVERCDFIDLGLDGIDRCDAPLNRIGVNDAAIKSANLRARECMGETMKVLQRRYQGKGFLN